MRKGWNNLRERVRPGNVQGDVWVDEEELVQGVELLDSPLAVEKNHEIEEQWHETATAEFYAKSMLATKLQETLQHQEQIQQQTK